MTSLDTGASNSGSETGITGATISPPALRLFLAVAVYRSDSVDPVDFSSVSGFGLTWTLVGTVDNYDTTSTSRRLLALYTAYGPPVSGAISVTFGYTANSYSFVLDGFDQTNIDGSVVQSAKNDTANALATNVTVSLSAFGVSGVTYTVMGGGLGFGGDTTAAEGTYTPISHAADAGENSEVRSAFFNGSDTSVVWASTPSGTKMAAIAVEVKAGPIETMGYIQPNRLRPRIFAPGLGR